MPAQDSTKQVVLNTTSNKALVCGENGEENDKFNACMTAKDTQPTCVKRCSAMLAI